MDVFIEKLVKKRKSTVDLLLIVLIIIGTLGLSFLSFVYVPFLSTFLIVGLIYLAYILITMMNVEYEYAVTNGDLDIDKIINQRKRKRMFSGNCKEFEVVAPVKSRHYTRDIQSCNNVLNYSSNSKDAEVWFISIRKEGKHTVILFEPNQQMIDNFRIFIPRKIFNE